MKLNKIIQERRFDKRIAQWGLRHNMITPQEYQAHIKALPDLTNQKEDKKSPQKQTSKKNK